MPGVLRKQKFVMKRERVTGIEPVSSAWKAEVLPLHNTRSSTSEPAPRDWFARQYPFIMAVRLPLARA